MPDPMKVEIVKDSAPDRPIGIILDEDDRATITINGEKVLVVYSFPFGRISMHVPDNPLTRENYNHPKGE